MSSPNNPKNGKGKRKADNASNSSNDNNNNNSNTTSDSNSTGSTTPRATPRATSTSTPGANANASSSSTPSRAPVPSAFPRPMPPIDHSRKLEGYNFMPSASKPQPLPSAASQYNFMSSASQMLPAPSPAPFSYDGIFGELQRRFTKLSQEEARISAKEKAVRDGQKLVVKAAERNKSEIEQARKNREFSNAVWKAAVDAENDNKKEKERLSGMEAELKQRLADLERRESAFERRASIHQQFASNALGAALDAVGRTAPTQHIDDPMTSAGDLSSSSNLFQQYSDNLFSSTVADPPRGRTLSSPHILEHQLLSTTSSNVPFRSRANQSSPIPIRPRTIHARHVSSESLSLTSPTPRRALREEDLRRIAEFGSVPVRPFVLLK